MIMSRDVVMERVQNLVRYFVCRRLSGDLIRLKAMYDYFVNNLSPSEIAGKYGIHKTVVSGMVRRVIELAGKEWIARWVLRILYRRLLGVDPIVVVVKSMRGSTYYCLICSKAVRDPFIHVRTKHKDIVGGVLRAVLDGVRV